MTTRFFSLLMTAWFMIIYPAAADALADVRAVTLTWTDEVQTTQTIAWQTSLPDPFSYLQYRKAGGKWQKEALRKSETSLFTTEERDNFIQRVHLRGLDPNTRYEYRIGDGTTWLKQGVFTTAGESSSFKFLLFSDSQSYDYRIWKNTFEAACLSHPDAAFYVVVGDLVDNGQKQREWDGWFQAVENFSSNLPLVPVVGNHETYTPERTFSLPRYFTAQFAVWQNGPRQLKGQVYSFPYGAAHFAVLDTQFGEERAFIPDSFAQQKKWLAEDLKKAAKPWKIVLMHRPVYPNRIYEASAGEVGKFAPIFDAYDVDIVFSGHEHVVARTEKRKAGRNSAKGTVYAAVGRSGTKTYDVMEMKPWNAQFFNPLKQPVYYVVDVEDKRLGVRVFQSDGALLDEWQLTK